MTANILLEAIEYTARELKRESDTYDIGAALDSVAIHARTLEISQPESSNSQHNANCLGDCCVQIKKGKLFYRDGRVIPKGLSEEILLQ